MKRILLACGVLLMLGACTDQDNITDTDAPADAATDGRSASAQATAAPSASGDEGGESTTGEAVPVLDAAGFDAAISESTRPVLVDFGAEWCGPCQQLKPILHDFATKHADELQVYQVDVDEQRELAKKVGIRALPTLVFYRNGEEHSRLIGLQNAERLTAALAKLDE